MSWMTYGIIIIFGAFLILMIINPNLSCFGKRIASPLYPLMRKKKLRNDRIKTEDYGFHLSDPGESRPIRRSKIEDEELFLDRFKNKKIKTKDYGFHLENDDAAPEKEEGIERQ
ncbi:MAG: hypothetical protein JXB23_09050 [Candidatus Aminicenantes bacterium]|nr:hypothetical protein [Candidatus Aminicenantes bacterium]